MSVINEELYKALKKRLREKPATILEMVKFTKLSRRTVYRYLALLEERGENLWRLGIHRPTQYRIGGRA